MAMTLEEQERDYAKAGFCPDKDYEVPEFTREDHQLFCNLVEHARNAEPKEKSLDELARASISYDVMRAYRHNPKGVRSFARQLREAGESNLPGEALFDRLDIYLRYEGIKDLIIIDGGEIRESTAYEDDGVTPKKGFKRLYWK